VDAHDRVRGIVLSTEEFLQLRRFDFFLPFIEMGNEIVPDVLTLFGPVDEGDDLLLAAVQLFDELEVRGQTATLPRELFTFGGIGPNVGVGELAF